MSKDVIMASFEYQQSLYFVIRGATTYYGQQLLLGQKHYMWVIFIWVLWYINTRRILVLVWGLAKFELLDFSWVLGIVAFLYCGNGIALPLTTTRGFLSKYMLYNFPILIYPHEFNESSNVVEQHDSQGHWICISYQICLEKVYKFILYIKTSIQAYVKKLPKPLQISIACPT